MGNRITTRAEAIFRVLDGQEFRDGGVLAAAIFQTYQMLFEPTIPVSDYARIIKIGIRNGWLIDSSESGVGARVQMPAA